MQRLVPFLFFSIALAPSLAIAEPTYPRGTTLEQAWLDTPRIPAAEAVDVLTRLFLDPHEPGTERDLGPEEFEALKYLVGNHRHSVEEASEDPGRRRFAGEITPDDMTVEDDALFEALSFAFAQKLGTASIQNASGGCVAQKRLWEAVKYKYDIGWNEVEVWGIAAFGHNVQYGVNHSDLIYGVFPFGVRMSWWSAVKCGIDPPDDAEGLRACGSAKQWKIHGQSWIALTSPYDAAVPGVGQTSLTYLGALASGEAGQFRTNAQTRSTDNTWLLGPANTPLPSSTRTGRCIACNDYEVPMVASYKFTHVISWFPNIILNASYNNLIRRDDESFWYNGTGDGNPHGLKTWKLERFFSRHHQPLPGCN